MVVVRHGDIGVKSARVQTWMERMLQSNIEAMLRSRSLPGEVDRVWGRIFVETPEPEAVADAVGDVFGVVSASPTRSVEPTLGAISEVLVETASAYYTSGSFAVDARRTGDHEFTSQDVGEVGGTAIWEAVEDEFEPEVDLDDPDIRFEVEVREETAFVFVDRVEGPGGLPVGTQDPVVALISGGIDSPVAAWLAMKRGAPIIPLYLDLGSFGGPDHRGRAMETIETLSRFAPQEEWEVYVAPIGAALERLDERVEDTRMLSVRRLMYMVANHVAAETGADAIVTGEALGQKSSQTLRNMRVTETASERPVLRPLLTWDKQEIIARAREIGTYKTATIDAGCNRIAPDQPETRATLERVTGAEPDGLAEWAREAAEDVEVIPLGQPEAVQPEGAE